MEEREAHTRQLAAQGLTFGPPPPWVVERDVPEASDSDAAVRFLLSDTQVNITHEHIWTHRIISQAVNSAGVDSIASFTTAYLPSFQKLIIHRVRLIRSGVAIDLADPERFQLLRREPNLERRIYDGALTADMQLSDVRPGDALETWFTVVGSNPALKGTFDASFALAFSVPVERTFVRLRSPTSRKLSIEILPSGSVYDYVESAPEPDVIEREWRVQREAPFVYDECTPPWWASHKRINVEDALTWGNIADLFREAYATPEHLPESLEEEMRRIEAMTPHANKRAIEALRFVQSSIRYLAVSIGNAGFLPREVEQIWASRFGDCKDVSRLLVAMLTRLGIKSAPALVCTQGKDLGRKLQPHVFAFDHCIVRVEIDGVVRWLDPTAFASGGDFGRVAQPDLGLTLPLVENAEIETLPLSTIDTPVLESTEQITFGGRASAPVDLRAETIHRDWKADQLRAVIRRDGVPALSEYRRKYFERAYNGAQPVSPLEVMDDLDANEIRLVERYTLDKAWTIENEVAHFHQSETIGPDLQVLPQNGRAQPLWLGAPRRYRRITNFIAPVSWPLAPWDLEAETVGMKGHATLSTSLQSTREFQLEFDYAITHAPIQPADFADFAGEYAKLRRGASVSLSIPLSNDVPETKTSERMSPDLAGFLAFFLMMAVAAGVVFLKRSI